MIAIQNATPRKKHETSFSIRKLTMFISRFRFSFYCTEPNAPPQNVRGRHTSSTSILVQWDDVPKRDQNGIILSYTVTYKTHPGGTPKTEVVDIPTKQVTLTGLNEYTNYSITVFASTFKGDGNVSEPIIVITDEDSKLFGPFITRHLITRVLTVT